MQTRQSKSTTEIEYDAKPKYTTLRIENNVYEYDDFKNFLRNE
jgi:hypothetical protein